MTYALIHGAHRLMWWHIQSLIWGEGKVAEYVAKLRMWWTTPSQYRGRDAPIIEAITSSVRVPSQSPNQTHTAGKRARSTKEEKPFH